MDLFKIWSRFDGGALELDGYRPTCIVESSFRFSSYLDCLTFSIRASGSATLMHLANVIEAYCWLPMQMKGRPQMPTLRVGKNGIVTMRLWVQPVAFVQSMQVDLDSTPGNERFLLPSRYKNILIRRG
jgi:hypothetical protein